MAIEYRGERFAGYNKPKRTPKHPKKSHAVLAKEGDTIKLIRFGQQGVKGAGSNPKTAKDKARKKSYYARHNAQDANPSKLSARYWSHKVKWTIAPIGIILLLGLNTGESYAKLQFESKHHLSSVQSGTTGTR